MVTSNETTYSVSTFKAKALGILEQVQRTQRPVLITKRGKPIARVEPIREERQQRILGNLRDSVLYEGDIVTPLGPDDWEACQ